jgi:acetolactate synthase-1/2/3 large subunit
VIRTLEAEGVDHVFGVCGDTSIGLYRAFEEHDHDIQHVLARDERGAAYMADAYARLSDRPGVCEAPSGGGATYLLPGLAEATDSAIPVVALNTDVPVRYRGRGVLTELNQGRLFDTVTKWNATLDHPDQVSRMLRQAFRQATTGKPGAAHLSLPIDVLDGTTDERVYGDEETTRYPAHRPRPSEAAVDRARALIADSDRPVMVVGGGVHSSRAWEPVRSFAEHLGIPVAQTLTSAGCIGASPYSIGVVGENGGREYADEILAEADTVLLFGTAAESVWTDKWSQPRDEDQSIVHADIDPGSVGLNFETDVALAGDLRESVTLLAEELRPAEKWSPAELAARHREWIEPYEARFTADEFPIRPERMVAGAREVLDDDAVIVSDPGTSCPYFAALYPFPTPGRHWVTPRAHGALGYTIPGVVGAQFARPDSQIVGFTGDGSFGTSVGDLETVSRLDLPVTIVVVNNASFSWIEAGQRSYADFSFGVDFEALDHAQIAEEFGLAGFRVESADEYEATLREAVELDGPALVDLPTRPLPSIDDAPVDWLEPED